MPVDEERLQQAIKLMGEAMAHCTNTEKTELATLKKQVDDAAATPGADFDKRLEFCYAILFTPAITNEKLRGAAKMYVEASGA